MTRFLNNSCGEQLYAQVKALPIVDFHCHLSPREIREDKPFDNLAQLWLGGDHYKWRLMRQFGIDENDITGDAPWREKFRCFLRALEFAAGNPLYHWCKLELEQYFGIDLALTAQNADLIYDRAGAVIARDALCPRKLIARSGVEYIATTDDPADPLDEHLALAADSAFSVRVTPSFRTDRLLTVNAPDYAAYIARLGAAANVQIHDLATMRSAIEKRLDDFCVAGCRMTDVGIPAFPDHVASDAQTDETLKTALAGNTVSEAAWLGLLGNFYVYLAQQYRARNLVMQWHLGPMRNVNSALFRSVGADAGGDVAANAVSVSQVAALLDAIEQAGGLPRTILYALRQDMAQPLGILSGAFRNVTLGAAWWFCDTKLGITAQLETIAETGCLGKFPGMLTDSRSFLSYARHDYYRRLVCNLLGAWVEAGEYAAESAAALAAKLCYENAKQMTEGKL